LLDRVNTLLTGSAAICFSSLAAPSQTEKQLRERERERERKAAAAAAAAAVEMAAQIQSAQTTPRRPPFFAVRRSLVHSANSISHLAISSAVRR